jgi:hypothetical protein
MNINLRSLSNCNGTDRISSGINFLEDEIAKNLKYLILKSLKRLHTGTPIVYTW